MTPQAQTAHTKANANVDPAELAKFGALASRWLDLDSEFKPLHEINPLRLNHIDKLVGIKGKRVLDVGCGGGIEDALALDADQLVDMIQARSEQHTSEL